MRRQLRLLGVSQIPGGHLNWSHIAQLSMSAWHASGGIRYPNRMGSAPSGERRIMTARVRRDLWEVASGPLR